MSDWSGVDTMFEYYNGEEPRVEAAAVADKVEKPVAPAGVAEGETEQHSIDDDVKDRAHDRALEQMMEDVKSFIRKLDVNSL